MSLLARTDQNNALIVADGAAIDDAALREVCTRFTATLIGLDSSVSYYVRDHLAVEGDITSAFEAIVPTTQMQNMCFMARA